MQNTALSGQHYTRLWKVVHYINFTCNAKLVALHITKRTNVMHCNALPLHLAFP